MGYFPFVPQSIPASGGTITGNLTVDGTLSTANGPILVLQATTGVAGFALQNATPTIISWTAPNDGNLHRFIVICSLDVSSAETGGAVSLVCTPPGAGAQTTSLYAGGLGTGPAYNTQERLVQPGTTVTVEQSSALTGGAATVWAEIWGS